jgi:hypothetical protein
MKLAFFTLIFCVFVVVGLQAQVSENRTLTAFDQVSIHGRFLVVLQAGEAESIQIESNEMPTADVLTRTEKGVLTVKKRQDFWDHFKSLDYDEDFEVRGKVKLLITYKNLAEVRLHGSGILQVESPLNVPQFTAKTSGSGKIIINELHTKHLFAGTSGSGRIKIKQGDCQTQAIKMSGSGKIELRGFACQNSESTVRGSGDLHVKVNEKLTAKVSGSGNIVYYGSPLLESKVSGSGNIKSSQ